MVAESSDAFTSPDATSLETGTIQRTRWLMVADPMARQHSPAAERNRQPILAALRDALPTQGTALEIASGTGQHVAWFAAALPGWTWQPSDAQADGFASIACWCAEAGVVNVAPPVVLDVMQSRWPVAGPEFDVPFDAIYCANMLHISPWQTCAALMSGAARHLAPEGSLITYGPHLERNVVTSAGNLEFDASLRQTNAAWGIRPLHDVADEASRADLRLSARVQMPANNLLLVFKRVTASVAPPG